MNKLTVWKSMLWKEIKCGRVYAMAAFITSPLFMLLESGIRRAQMKPYDPNYAQNAAPHVFVPWGQMTVILIVPLLIVIWAAMRGSEHKRERLLVMNHLPMGEDERLCIGLLLPAIVCGCIGSWAQMWDWTLALCIPIEDLGGVRFYMNITWFASFAALYALTWVISFRTSKWTALLLGALWGRYVLAYALPDGGILTDDSMLQSVYTRQRLYSILMIIISILLYYPSKLNSRLWAVVAVIFGVLATAGPRAYVAIRIGNEPFKTVIQEKKDEFYESYIDMELDNDTEYFTEEKHLLEKRLGKGVVILYRSNKLEPYKLIAQQSDNSSLTHIYYLDCHTNKITRIVSIHTGKLLYGGWIFAGNEGISAPEGLVSPDNRWLILQTRSCAGIGLDGWLIDVSAKRAKLVMINIRRKDKAIWKGDYAFLTGAGAIVKLYLDSGKAFKIAIPSGEEMPL